MAQAETADSTFAAKALLTYHLNAAQALMERMAETLGPNWSVVYNPVTRSLGLTQGEGLRLH